MPDEIDTPFNTWKGPPTFTNAEGVKWWLDRSATSYAQGKGMQEYSAWAVETPAGERSRVWMRQNDAGGELVYESKALEDFMCHMDILALACGPCLASQEKSDDCGEPDDPQPTERK